MPMTSGRSSATPRQRRGTHWPGGARMNIDTTTTTTQLKSEIGGDRLLLHVLVGLLASESLCRWEREGV